MIQKRSGMEMQKVKANQMFNIFAFTELGIFNET
jgi:hypothetical protein